MTNLRRGSSGCPVQKGVHSLAIPINSSVFLATISLVIVLLTGLAIIVTTLYTRSVFRKENERKFRELLVHGIIFKSTIEIEERHKERIATNLHDGVNSLLTLLMYSLSRHQQNLLANKFKGSDLERDKRLVQKIMKEVRDTCNNLVPVSLRQLGLLKALEEHMENIRSSEAVNADFVCHARAVDMTALHERDQLSIYRICQEVLNNILKHAGCSRLSLSVFFRKDELFFEFTHDGSGISNEDMEALRGKGLGLNSLKTRILLLKAGIDYSKGRNTSSVTLRVPIT